MKKVFFSIIFIAILIICVIAVKISSNNREKSEIAKFNSQFDEHLGKTIYGTDVLTIINKAMDNNEALEVKKDDKNFYIENEETSLKVDITLLSTDSEGKITEVTYPMENLQKADLNKFVSSFGLTSFECTNIEYNSKNRVKKVYLKQLQLCR